MKSIAQAFLLLLRLMVVFDWRFRRTTLLIVGLAAFLLGMGFARLRPGADSALILLSTILCVLTFRKKGLAAAICIFLLGFSLGWVRGVAFRRRLSIYEDYYGQKIVISGTAASDGIYVDNGQLEFDMKDLEVLQPEPASLVGTIQIRGFGEPAVFRGDNIQVEGKLFFARGSRQGRISYAELKVTGHALPLIERLRLGFNAGMQNALPEPLSSFGLGLLIGQRATLPQNVNDQLSIVGLTHLIAVSGYNLTIIIRAARRLFGKRSKYQMLMLSAVLIGLFLMFTGMSASIVRAAIVSFLSLGAWYYGRRIRPLLVILLAAALTAGWNPLYLWSDIGWYLSFLAFFGVLILAPLIMLRFFKSKKPSNLTQLIIESICAQAMTMPLILYIFSRISVIGLVSNVLVVPLVPLAMLLSLGAGLSGMLAPAVAGWFAWPARWVLTYILDIVGLMSRIPHALIKRSLLMSSMIVMYLIIILTSLILWSKVRSKNGTITDEELLETEGA